MNKLKIDNDQFRALISKICRDIAVSGWRPDYIVGITRGGLIPAVMISHYLGVPMKSLDVSLRDGGDTETNAWMAEDAYGYNEAPKNILIVDDINDTGATLDWIIQDWQGNPQSKDRRWDDVWGNNVRFAVLIDNEESEATIDYSAWDINKAANPEWCVFHWESWWNP